MSSKNKKNLISVIITNFNKGRFIEKSLISVFKQNHKYFEVILFDDCSTDNSMKILKKFKRFKKFKLIINKKKKFNFWPFK